MITLFHEFGHGLHHMLTRIDTAGVSGISGVPWDAVELPSQFMENWCWEPEALAFISGHYETGEPLPQELLEKMLAAKNYQAAMFILRQLEFGLFDFRLHAEFSPQQGAKILETLAEIKQQVALIPGPSWGRFRTPSAIFSPADTQRVITAICGPTSWRRMPSRASKRRVSSIAKPASRSSTTSLAAAVRKSQWSCSNASAVASRSWTRCLSITVLRVNPVVKICLIDETGAGDGALSVLADRWGWSRMRTTRWRW